jgi:hypothetical protein
MNKERRKDLDNAISQRIRYLEDPPLPTVQLNGPILMVVAGIAAAVVMLAAHALYIWLH